MNKPLVVLYESDVDFAFELVKRLSISLSMLPVANLAELDRILDQRKISGLIISTSDETLNYLEEKIDYLKAKRVKVVGLAHPDHEMGKVDGKYLVTSKSKFDDKAAKVIIKHFMPAE